MYKYKRKYNLPKFFTNFQYDPRKRPGKYMNAQILWKKLDFEKEVMRDNLLYKVQEGRGAGSVWSFKFNNSNKMLGPKLPFDFYSRYVFRGGDYWTLALHNEPKKRWKVQLVQRSEKLYEFGNGWPQFAEDNKLQHGDHVGFSVTENINALFVIFGEEDIERHVCTEFPSPYIKYWEFLGVPERQFLSHHEFKHFKLREQILRYKDFLPNQSPCVKSQWGQRQTNMLLNDYPGYKWTIPTFEQEKKRQRKNEEEQKDQKAELARNRGYVLGKTGQQLFEVKW